MDSCTDEKRIGPEELMQKILEGEEGIFCVGDYRVTVGKSLLPVVVVDHAGGKRLVLVGRGTQEVMEMLERHLGL